MKKILKNSEILALYQALKNLPPHFSGIRFLYAATRNVQKLKEVAGSLASAEYTIANFRQQDKTFIKYEEERIELARSYASRDAEGNPLTRGIDFQGGRREIYDVPPEKEAELEKAVEILQKKYRKAFDLERKCQEDFSMLMDESSEVDLYMVPLPEVPETIQSGLFSQIYPIIEEVPDGRV